MYQDRIEFLKRAIKRNYKWYTGEREDGKATITDVANFFNIPIDDDRLLDYQITKINFKEPELQIVDTKTNTTYNANYTGDADLLNYFCGGYKFISLISTNSERKIESLYYIDDEKPIATKMTFSDNDYDLVFFKETPNYLRIFNNGGETFIVRYLKNIDYKGENIEQELLTRAYVSKYSENSYKNFDDTFEQIYTYGLYNHIDMRDKNKQNKYSYVVGDNLIYGINELEQKDLAIIMHGICFENTKINTKDYFPYDLRAEDYPTVNDDKTNSAVIFRGWVGKSDHNTLEIYKSDEATSLKYHVERFIYDERLNKDKETLVDWTYTLPNLNKGNISGDESGDELENIIVTLQEEFSNDVFIGLVSNELKTFKEKIDIRKGLVQEELDPLSPKLLFDKTFDEIERLVIADKSYYFDLISDKFNEVANPKPESKKPPVKVLKPSKK